MPTAPYWWYASNAAPEGPHGTFERIELDDTTQDANFLGFTGSGLKAINEVEVRNSYIHDNQGNGLWCDEFCHDSESHLNGFWIHENVTTALGPRQRLSAFCAMLQWVLSGSYLLW